MGKSLSFSVHDHLYSAEIYDDHFVEISFPHTTGIREISVEGEPMLQVYTGTEHIVIETEEVDTDGGHLKVLFEYDPASKMYHNLKLAGPAYFVFKGSYYV